VSRNQIVENKLNWFDNHKKKETDNIPLDSILKYEHFMNRIFLNKNNQDENNLLHNIKSKINFKSNDISENVSNNNEEKNQKNHHFIKLPTIIMIQIPKKIIMTSI
jgi:hypothetical protein